MKKKNGFTLIELVVVIALIAILAVTLAPRLRDQIAKANDSKAIALLGSMRTASEVYFADNNQTVAAANSMTTLAQIDAAILSDLEEGLDNSAKSLLAEGTALYAPIGGGRTAADASINYGGEVSFTFVSPEPTVTSGDGISLWFTDATSDATGTGTDFSHDTKNNPWASY